MPSKARKDIIQFIEGLRDDILSGLPDSGGHETVATSQNYRLDRQSLTSDDPKRHNLQVQVNNGATKPTSLKVLVGRTVSIALVPTDGSWTPQQIRDELIRNIYSNI